MAILQSCSWMTPCHSHRVFISSVLLRLSACGMCGESLSNHSNCVLAGTQHLVSKEPTHGWSLLCHAQWTNDCHLVYLNPSEDFLHILHIPFLQWCVFGVLGGWEPCRKINAWLSCTINNMVMDVISCSMDRRTSITVLLNHPYDLKHILLTLYIACQM